MSRVSIDVLRRVFDNDHGVFIEIAPWPDDPDAAIVLHTTGEKNIEWFGKLELTMGKDFAVAIANAILASVADTWPQKGEQ